MILLKNVSNQKNPPDEMSHNDPKKSLSDELIVRKFRILPELSDIYMPHSMERGKLLVCGRSFCAVKFSGKLVGTQWQRSQMCVTKLGVWVMTTMHACVCARGRLHGGLEDRCVSRRESDVGAQKWKLT